MTNIKIKDLDIAIIVTPKGEARVFIPNDMEDELTPQELSSMLREIRKLELVFAELVNNTFVPENEHEEEVFERD